MSGIFRACGSPEPTVFGQREGGAAWESARAVLVIPVEENDTPCSPIWRPKILLRPSNPNVLTQGQFDCALQSPCKRYTCPGRRTSYVLVMAKHNYKVYSNDVSSRNLLVRRLAVLDTGAGPSFIRVYELRPDERLRVETVQ